MDWDRNIIWWLLGGFVVLLTTFAVLMGASALAAAIGDPLSGRILLRVSVACLILLAVDAILLLVALAIRSISRP